MSPSTRTEVLAYHSFPRRRGSRAATNLKGIATLASMVASGLLLRPEVIAVPGEDLRDGTAASPVYAGQVSASFSVRDAQGLHDHASVVGPFSVEFTIEALVDIGALPVWYFPSRSKTGSGTGRTLIARGADIRHLLERLQELERVSRAAGDRIVTVTIGRHAPLDLRAVDVRRLLEIINDGHQPFEQLNAAYQVMGSLTYPVDATAEDELRFFEQREWRLISNALSAPAFESGPPTTAERARLLDLDRRYYSGTVEVRTGKTARVDRCVFVRRIRGRHFLSYARRVIVPEGALTRAREILEPAFPGLPVLTV